MVKSKAKSVQTSCKIDKTNLENFIKEVSDLNDIIQVDPKNIHEEIRFQLHDYTMIVYKSGKVVYHVYDGFDELLGKYCADFKKQTVEEIQQQYNYDEYDIIIGQDEVGKGEMYGPMITASVAIRPDQISEFKRIGIRDSKTISSKKKLHELTHFIEQHAVAVSVSRLYPRRFNELFLKMKEEEKNLNDLLAWQHSNALKSLLEKLDEKDLLNRKIILIIDEFDRFKTDLRIKNQLKNNIQVVQSTKAEKISVAVAAASVVAKDKRNDQVTKLEEKYGITLNNTTVKSLVNHPESSEFLKLSFIKNK